MNRCPKNCHKHDQVTQEERLALRAMYHGNYSAAINGFQNAARLCACSSHIKEYKRCERISTRWKHRMGNIMLLQSYGLELK